MLYSKYVFTSVLEGDAVLPPYKGSTFRGVFGHALKKVVCALKKQECVECLLRSRCVYALVFEPSELEPAADRRRMAASPHPYALEPDPESRTHYEKGEEFKFNLLLFGRINESLPYFVYAIDKMGEIGIGKSIEGRRPAFRLLHVVTDEGLIVYDEKSRKIQPPQERHLDLEHFSQDGDENVHSVTISLETPLRLKYQNHLKAEIPFHVLVRAILRRVSSLFNYHGEGEPPLDYRGLVRRAESVDFDNSNLRWYDWKRYSNRQDQAMFMGGMTGSVTYQGDLREFMPLIRFAEEVHLGKQTTFGLGKIRILDVKP